MDGGERGGRSKETCQREGGGALWVLCATGATDVNARPVPQIAREAEEDGQMNEKNRAGKMEERTGSCLHGRN